MRQITMYRADSGKLFESKADCFAYEKLIDDVDLVMKALPVPPDLHSGYSMESPDLYYQHDSKIVDNTKIELLKLMMAHIDHEWVQQTIDNLGNMDLSYVGRLVSASDIKPLSKAWNRFMCIDKDYKEWEQPYFVYHKSTNSKQVN